MVQYSVPNDEAAQGEIERESARELTYFSLRVTLLQVPFSNVRFHVFSVCTLQTLGDFYERHSGVINN